MIKLIIMFLLLLPNIVYADRGCCSWHGGQDYCDTSTGKWVCKDGTYSPNCTCSSYELTDNSKNANTITNSNIDSNGGCTCGSYKDEIKELNKEIQNKNSALIWISIIGGIILIDKLINVLSKRKDIKI